MTNEEIRIKIQEYQQKCLAAATTFELNDEVRLCKDKINSLRAQCTHQDENGEIKSFNNRCQYCGKKL